MPSIKAKKAKNPISKAKVNILKRSTQISARKSTP